MSKKSRTKKAMVNTICEILFEIVTAICGFILPRLILSHFGSTYNGITSSITQFIGYITLLKSGIGSVTRAALYKPLADNDYYVISEIVNATSKFMRKISAIFIISIIGFAAIYPFFVKDDFDWFFTFTLVLILSLSTFAQYFFGLTYQMVLQADQRNYIISITSIILVIVNTIVASILVLSGYGIHIVKLGSAVVFIIPPIFYNIYVRKHYNIDCKVTPNFELISQRWDAFGHQLANFINNNTDIIVATVLLGVREVSVYTVYHFVAQALKKTVSAIGSGTTAAFGNMIAQNENEKIKIRFEQFELLIFYITTIIISISIIMITPFVSVYTKGVNDVNYIRPIFGILVCLSIYFTCIRIPYEQIVYAAGEFKKTRNGAFVEAGINIFLSIILSLIIGLNGIMIGTIVALAYRTIRYHMFICKNIIERSISTILTKILYSVIVIILCIFISRIFSYDSIYSYFTWIIYAFLSMIVSVFVSTFIGYVFFGKKIVSVFKLIFQTFLKTKKK